MRHFFCIFIAFISLTVGLSSSPKLHVVTVSNKEVIGLKRLLHSAKHYGHDVTVLGMDKPYKNHFVKVRHALEFAESLPGDAIILFVDAWDVFLLGTPEEFISRFLEFNRPIVFSAERHYHPKVSVIDLIGEYPYSPTTLKYLNSGSFIGYARDIRIMIKDVLRHQYRMPLKRYYNRLNDDQYHYHRYLARHYTRVERDMQGAMFLPLAYVERNELIVNKEEKSVLFKETGQKTLLIHGNGTGYPLMEQIYDLLFPNTVQ